MVAAGVHLMLTNLLVVVSRDGVYIPDMVGAGSAHLTLSVVIGGVGAVIENVVGIVDMGVMSA